MIATMNMTTYSHFRKRTRCKVLSHSDFIFAKLVYFLLLCDNFVFIPMNFQRVMPIFFQGCLKRHNFFDIQSLF